MQAADHLDGKRVLVINQVRIFTGTDVIESGYVVITDALIAEVGPGSGPSIESLPHGASAISMPGHTLAPGLIDCHIHALSGNANSIEQSLRFGVTTVCDMHNSPHDNEELLKLSSDPANKSKYSDFKCAGLGAVVENGWPIPVMRKEFDHLPHGRCIADKIISTWPRLKRPADARTFVDQQVDKNHASYIKMFHEVGDTIGMDDVLPQPPMDVQAAVVEAAHRRGIVAVGHAFSQAGAIALLEARADGLTHMFLDKAVDLEGFTNTMRAKKAHCSPTLALCGSQTGESQDLQQRFLDDPFAQKMLLFKSPGRPVGFAVDQPRSRVGLEHAVETTKALYHAGVPILVGTDAAGKDLGMPYGLGVHMEMYILAHMVGMSPIDVLHSATSVIADMFGFNDRGRIEIGKKADLVLFEGNILEDPSVLCLPIKAVWREGVCATAFEM
ncbi:hypothetical protein HK405_000824 [Cladochytrium tenue]|nr:hypothetical protein HK405_000824 [Cladochytrium tenue]